MEQPPTNELTKTSRSLTGSAPSNGQKPPLAPAVEVSANLDQAAAYAALRPEFVSLSEGTLDGLSDETLKALEAQAKAAKERRRVTLIATFREKAQAALAFGLTPAELAAALGWKLAPAARKIDTDGRHDVKPKYRHPQDPTLTWTGRGGKPQWVRDYLAAGGTMEELAIPEDAL
jgi:DNA-binding protein H-NS